MEVASALEVGSQTGGLVHFKDTTLDTLVDSPVLCGPPLQALDLSTDASTKSSWTYSATKKRTWRSTPNSSRCNRNMVKERPSFSLRTITTTTIFYSY